MVALQLILQAVPAAIFATTAFFLVRNHNTKNKSNSIIASGSSFLSEQDIKTFQQDGVIIIRNLISGQDLIDAQKIANDISKQKSIYNSYKAIKFQNWKSNKSLKNIAIYSKAAKIASELININNHGNSDHHSSSSSIIPVRMLKEAILSFGKGSTGCGWHVDDKMFWPCRNELTGINVWIALSPISVKQGGGLAVAKGSYKMKWAQDSIPIIHEGTFKTCSMEKLNEGIHRKFEAIKLEWDMQPGDAIIHDRWCFHRSENFHDENSVDDDVVLNRYSIRYMPENAQIVDLKYQGSSLDPELTGKEGHELRMYPNLFPRVN